MGTCILAPYFVHLALRSQLWSVTELQPGHSATLSKLMCGVAQYQCFLRYLFPYLKRPGNKFCSRYPTSFHNRGLLEHCCVSSQGVP